MTDILPEDEAFLAHYGVKGMRWGVRKSKDSSEKSKSPKEKRVSKRKRRVQARIEAGQKKATELLVDAHENPNNLYMLNGRAVVTGREFTDYLLAGNPIDVSRSGIFARQTGPNGEYERT